MNRTDREVDQLAKLIACAAGHEPADLVVRGANLVNVFTGEIYPADVAIKDGRIVGLDDYDARDEIDASGLYLAPGLIDGHFHLESALLSPAEFARMALPLGATTVVIDPHEIANVAGVEGIRQLIRATEGLPVTFYIMVPSCVPASDLETSGAELTAADVETLGKEDRVLGLAEVMNVPGVLSGEFSVIEKIVSCHAKAINGHAPGLRGRDLNAYVAAGMRSDHETTDPYEGLEKMRAGMYLMVREGSAARNLDDLLRIVKPRNARRCMLVTDDLLPTDIDENGYINYLLKRAVADGIEPVTAIQMATLNAAERFCLPDRGAIAPGYRADIVAFPDLEHFEPAFVIANGRLAAKNGEVVGEISARAEFDDRLMRSVNALDVCAEDLRIRARHGLCRAIGAVGDQIITEALTLKPTTHDGWVVADVKRDLLKMAVVERHCASGRIGLGLIRGFGLHDGAIGSSVAHDSHNLVAIGTNDEDMALVFSRLMSLRGGLVVASDGKVLADLPLPIGGLMSDLPVSEVVSRLRGVEKAARDLGCVMNHPFMTLSFMCLSVLPELKLTDRGLVDATTNRIVGLFEEAAVAPPAVAAVR